MKGKILFILAGLALSAGAVVVIHGESPDCQKWAGTPASLVLVDPGFPPVKVGSADLVEIPEPQRADKEWIRVKYAAATVPGFKLPAIVRIRGPTKGAPSRVSCFI